MRRGLIAWSEEELPRTVFAERVARARTALAGDGLDALIAYTNHTRPAAASWLTGFIPYWSEGALLLPRDGEPQLLVALSKRVQGWVERTSCAGEVVSTPRLPAELAARARSAGSEIGVLEAATLPVGIADALAAAGARLRDATALFDRLHAHADDAEIALARRAARIAARALDTVSAERDDVGDAVARIERSARLDGAEEVLIAVAPDLRSRPGFLRPFGTGRRFADRFAVRVTVAYKGAWVRATRTFDRSGHDLVGADAPFARALAALPAVAALEGTEWLIEGTVRSQPLQPLASAQLGVPSDLRGKIVSVSVLLPTPDGPVAAGAAVHVGAGALV